MCNKNNFPQNKEARVGAHRRAGSVKTTVRRARRMSEGGATKAKVPPVSLSNRKK